MKIHKIIILLMVMPFIGIIIESCCNCSKPKDNIYSIENVTLFAMDNTSINAMMGNGTDNADANPLTFRKDFGVTIQFNTTILIPECAQSSSFFVQSAHACSCNIGSFFPQDSVTAIRVVADKDFDDTHMAGSNVADFFQIREWNGNTKFPYLTSFEDYFSRSAPIYIGTTPNYWIDCLLTATNLTAGTYNFTFTFVFSDGHEIEKSIQAILE